MKKAKLKRDGHYEGFPNGSYDEPIPERKEGEFDLGKIYWKNKTPKEISRWISKLTDKELQLVILPTSETTCDILIRDIPVRRK